MIGIDPEGADDTLREVRRALFSTAVQGIIDDLLKQQFHDELKFNVDIVREFDDVGPGDGSPYLHVRIAVDGDFGLLLSRKKWTSEFVSDMGDTFAQHGIEDEPSPVTSFF